MNPETKSADELIKTIPIIKSNLEYIANTGEINGMLYVAIKDILNRYARQESERRIDEFIEKVIDGFIRNNYCEDIGKVAYEVRDWLKSLK